MTEVLFSFDPLLWLTVKCTMRVIAPGHSRKTMENTSNTIAVPLVALAPFSKFHFPSILAYKPIIIIYGSKAHITLMKVTVPGGHLSCKPEGIIESIRAAAGHQRAQRVSVAQPQGSLRTLHEVNSALTLRAAELAVSRRHQHLAWRLETHTLSTWQHQVTFWNEICITAPSPNQSDCSANRTSAWSQLYTRKCLQASD